MKAQHSLTVTTGTGITTPVHISTGQNLCIMGIVVYSLTTAVRQHRVYTLSRIPFIDTNTTGVSMDGPLYIPAAQGSHMMIGGAVAQRMTSAKR